jgi:NAD-dependent deacetylase
MAKEDTVMVGQGSPHPRRRVGEIETVAELIVGSNRIVVFTGAGASTESGIADFRSPGGIWDKYDPEDFYFQRFLTSEEAREKYWAMSAEVYGCLKQAKPNRVHLAIAELEKLDKLECIITQNIDGLHHKAGNSPEKIIELHGTALSVSCLSCGKKYDRDEVQERVRKGVRVPRCDDCGGLLKPDTISFGQAMPERETNLRSTGGFHAPQSQRGRGPISHYQSRSHPPRWVCRCGH